MRGTLAEFGVIARRRRRRGSIAVSHRGRRSGDPPALLPALQHLREQWPALQHLREQWLALSEAIDQLERQIVKRAKADPMMRLLTTIPGVGPLGAHAIVAAIGDGRQFGSARDFAAWAGLTPRERQSANTRRRGHISRQGDAGIRRLLTLGASTWLAMCASNRSAPRAGPSG